MGVTVGIVGLDFRKSHACDDYTTSFENPFMGEFSLGGTNYHYQSFGENFIDCCTGFSSLCVSFIKTTYSIRTKKIASWQHNNSFSIIDNIIERVFNKTTNIVNSILQLYFPDEFYFSSAENTKNAKLTQEDIVSFNECSENFFYKILQKKTYENTFLMLVFCLILLSSLLFKQKCFISERLINIFVLLMLYLLTYRHAVFRTKNLEICTVFITYKNIRSCYCHGKILGFSVENSFDSNSLSMGCS
ncbi:MAG: hypothetical protein E7533_02430 [Ruminococcaceae bacterium]|nr:hypothetical protein [Oscillospiraceae bacterium]